MKQLTSFKPNLKTLCIIEGLFLMIIALEFVFSAPVGQCPFPEYCECNTEERTLKCACLNSTCSRESYYENNQPRFNGNKISFSNSYLIYQDIYIDGLERIDEKLFSGTSMSRLANIKLSNIKYIERNAFYFASEINSIKINYNSIESIENNALNRLKCNEMVFTSLEENYSFDLEIFTGTTQINNLALHFQSTHLIKYAFSTTIIETPDALTNSNEADKLIHNWSSNASVKILEILELRCKIVLDETWAPRFKNLEKIMIYRTDISIISENFIKLHEDTLKYLILSDNKIEIIQSKTFTRFKNLKFLDLSNNPIKNIKPDAFNGLNMIETLDLREISTSYHIDEQDLCALSYLPCGTSIFLDKNVILSCALVLISDIQSDESSFLAIAPNSYRFLPDYKLEQLQQDCNLKEIVLKCFALMSPKGKSCPIRKYNISVETFEGAKELTSTDSIDINSDADEKEHIREKEQRCAHTLNETSYYPQATQVRLKTKKTKIENTYKIETTTEATTSTATKITTTTTSTTTLATTTKTTKISTKTTTTTPITEAEDTFYDLTTTPVQTTTKITTTMTSPPITFPTEIADSIPFFDWTAFPPEIDAIDNLQTDTVPITGEKLLTDKFTSKEPVSRMQSTKSIAYTKPNVKSEIHKESTAAEIATTSIPKKLILVSTLLNIIQTKTTIMHKTATSIETSNSDKKFVKTLLAENTFKPIRISGETKSSTSIQNRPLIDFPLNSPEFILDTDWTAFPPEIDEVADQKYQTEYSHSKYKQLLSSNEYIKRTTAIKNSNQLINTGNSQKQSALLTKDLIHYDEKVTNNIADPSKITKSISAISHFTQLFQDIASIKKLNNSSISKSLLEPTSTIKSSSFKSKKPFTDNLNLNDPENHTWTEFTPEVEDQNSTEKMSKNEMSHTNKGNIKKLHLSTTRKTLTSRTSLHLKSEEKIAIMSINITDLQSSSKSTTKETIQEKLNGPNDSNTNNKSIHTSTISAFIKKLKDNFYEKTVPIKNLSVENLTNFNYIENIPGISEGIKITVSKDKKPSNFDLFLDSDNSGSLIDVDWTAFPPEIDEIMRLKNSSLNISKLSTKNRSTIHFNSGLEKNLTSTIAFIDKSEYKNGITYKQAKTSGKPIQSQDSKMSSLSQLTHHFINTLLDAYYNADELGAEVDFVESSNNRSDTMNQNRALNRNKTIYAYTKKPKEKIFSIFKTNITKLSDDFKRINENISESNSQNIDENDKENDIFYSNGSINSSHIFKSNIYSLAQFPNNSNVKNNFTRKPMHSNYENANNPNDKNNNLEDYSFTVLSKTNETFKIINNSITRLRNETYLLKNGSLTNKIYNDERELSDIHPHSNEENLTNEVKDQVLEPEDFDIISNTPIGFTNTGQNKFNEMSYTFNSNGYSTKEKILNGGKSKNHQSYIGNENNKHVTLHINIDFENDVQPNTNGMVNSKNKDKITYRTKERINQINDWVKDTTTKYRFLSNHLNKNGHEKNSQEKLNLSAWRMKFSPTSPSFLKTYLHFSNVTTRSTSYFQKQFTFTISNSFEFFASSDENKYTDSKYTILSTTRMIVYIVIFVVIAVCSMHFLIIFVRLMNTKRESVTHGSYTVERFY